MATFSERFKELRKEKGMSQRELATAHHSTPYDVAHLAIQLIPEKCRIYQQFGDFSLLGNREM